MELPQNCRSISGGSSFASRGRQEKVTGEIRPFCSKPRSQPLTASTAPPNTSQSKAPHSPPPTSPTENKTSYSSPDKRYLPATGPKELAPLPTLRQPPAPTLVRSAPFLNPSCLQTPYVPTGLSPRLNLWRTNHSKKPPYFAAFAVPCRGHGRPPDSTLP
jgi:hypothetical protein